MAVRTALLSQVLQPAACRVSGLAGLPEPVIDRAKEVLANLEQGEFTDGGLPKLAITRKKKTAWDSRQIALFQTPPDPLRERLREVDPNRLTPLEALTILAELKSKME